MTALNTNLLSSSYEAYFIKRLFSRSSQATRHDTPADRVAAVAQLRLNPGRLVAYLSQTVVFTALPTDYLDRTVQGVPLTWESSNPDRIQIDEAGRATCLEPGLARIICRAGGVSASAPMFVRPNRRPIQTDGEWRADQSALRPDGTLRGMNGSGPADWIAQALDKLAPTALAQSYSNTDFPYDELWNDPANLVGSPRNRVMDSSHAGSVLPESNNFNMAIPLVSLGGRAVGASLALYYNSRVWSRHGNAITFDAIESRPSPGFSLGFGRLVTYGPSNALKYLWIEADGTRHYLGQGGSPSQDVTLHSNDGSHLTYVGNAAYYGTLYGNDGSSVAIGVVNNRMLPYRIADSNGNYITIAYKLTACDPNCSPCNGCNPIYPTLMLDYVTDTMGRIIQCNYNSNNNLVSITAPGFGGSAQNPVTTTVAQFDYENRTVSSSLFSGLTVENIPVQSSDFLKHVYIPATGTGNTFTYSAFGMIYSVSSRRQMSVNGSGVISDGVESNSVVFNYQTGSSPALTNAPAFTQRTESASNAPTATFSYSSSTNGFTQTKTFTTTRPDNSTLNLTRSTNVTLVANGLLTQTEIKTSGGVSMSKAVLTYANDPGGQPQIANIITYDDGTPTPNQTKLDYDYDSYGNVTNTREYGYQVSGQWKVRRRTHSVYKTDTSYVNVYLRSLVIESDVYDALLDTNDANDVMMSKTSYTIDDYAAMGGMEEYRDAQGNLPPPPPGHFTSYDATYTVRGNMTGATQYYDLTNNLFYTQLRKIDVFGNTVKEQLACCYEQTRSATQISYWAWPEQITKGAAGGPQLTTSTAFDFNTGVTNQMSDPNNLATTVTARDAALRPTTVTTPAGASKGDIHDDSTLSASRSISYDDNGSPRNITTTIDYDGWGRAIHQTNVHGGQVNTNYDAMGRVASVTTPFNAGASPGPATGYSYDALDRTTVVTLPDNQTVQTIYNGNSVTIVDQVNRKTQRLSDGLGRLLTLNEQDSSGNLSQATNHSYDALGNLTQVNQGNQLRSYRYDALSRMTDEKVPEQGDPTQGNQWTTSYTYTSFNGVATRTDARGVITTYAYDTLNRVSQVSYNTVTGVTTAPTVTYTYDTDPTYGTMKAGAIVRVNVGSDYQERYTFDQYKRVSDTIRAIGTQSYTTTNQYNQAGQPLLSATGAYQYDIYGRLSSITAAGLAMSAMTYNIAGQVTNDTLTSSGWNNGYLITSSTAETFGYDTNRMQLISQTAVTTNTNAGSCLPSCPAPPPGGTNLSLIYSYQATAGQMGAGTTAGNAGQLISASGTIGGLTDSASYTYDAYGRLMTSNQTSNGSNAQRRFVYDRWGNRSGMWDATAGGNQIQSVSLQAVNFPGTGSAPTNRITTVTSGATVNYSYDTIGNVINDGAHSYTFDSENRMVTVDNGATSYAYDHQNRRYRKTVGSSATHYVWEGRKVAGEYNGNNGTTLITYAYSGARLFGKSSPGIQVFLSNQSSVRLALSDVGTVAGRQAHLPYGEDFAETGTQEKHHFTSYERDVESGADYAINRLYQSITARFSSVDPVQDRARTPKGGGCGKSSARGPRASRSQSWNRYSYTENDPINRTDPMGLLLAEPEIPGLCPADYTTEMCMTFGLIGRGGWGSGDAGWRCGCNGTTDCSYYKEKCKNVHGKTDAALAYYCVAAKLVCRFAGDGCIQNCIRQSLQDLDTERNCIDRPTSALFTECQVEIHGIAYSVCIGIC